MTNLHRGQKVVCIDDEDFILSGYGDEQYPVAGQTYTVRDVTAVRSVPAIRVEEIVNDILEYKDGPHMKPYAWEQAFAARRFQPLVSGERELEIEGVV